MKGCNEPPRPERGWKRARSRGVAGSRARGAGMSSPRKKSTSAATADVPLASVNYKLGISVVR